MPSSSSTSSSNSLLTPFSSLKVSRHQIPSHNLLPNTSIQHRPLHIYHACFPPSQKISASQIESHLRRTAVVEPAWRYTMYSTSHYHSTTHEVLCVSAGKARLCFGGEENPGRVEIEAQAGDVMVVPAGVAHRLLEDLSAGGAGFEMVGSYPRGAEAWDMCYGKAGEEGKAKRIGGLGWFDRDPVYGDDGPVLES